MGKLCFSKAVKFFAFALLGAATAIAAVAVLSAPAAADPSGGGGGGRTLKAWDTDNLAYGGYSARNFRVPFHEYGGYSGFVFSENSVFQGRARDACQTSIADGFFQAGGSVGAKNDFPVLDKNSGVWADLPAGTRSGGCGDFVANQHLAVERSSAVGGGGFYLDIAGNLQSGLNSRVLRDYGLRTRSYTHWTASGSGRSYAHTFVRAAAKDGSILASVRPYGSEAYSASRVVTRSPGSGYVGIAGASSNSYPHPLPQCTDPVTRRKRSWTQTELGYYTVGEEFPAAEDGSTRCNERTPARAADFASDPCVTISLDIYENRTAGEAAAPGVAVSDRTRTATDQMPGWDLGVSAGHFDSASPLLDTTGSDKDPSGCADGTESRGDHGSAPASAERTNSQASAPPLRRGTKQPTRISRTL